MAIWQVAFSLVNEEMNFKYFEPKFLSSVEKLKETFPEEKSWSESIKQFGSLDSTCIEIGFLDDVVVDNISLRIDLRNISQHQLQALCDFAKYTDLFLQYEDKLYDATIDNFISIFKKSNAYKFLTNPIKYLKQIPNPPEDSSPSHS